MIELAATLCGLLFGAVATLLAVQQHIHTLKKNHQTRLEEEKQRHSQSEVKAYAAQRDFQHLERHLGQHKEAIRVMQEDVDRLEQNQIEMKTLLTASYNQIQILLQQSGHGVTGGYGNPSNWKQP